MLTLGDIYIQKPFSKSLKFLNLLDIFSNRKRFHYNIDPFQPKKKSKISYHLSQNFYHNIQSCYDHNILDNYNHICKYNLQSLRFFSSVEINFMRSCVDFKAKLYTSSHFPPLLPPLSEWIMWTKLIKWENYSSQWFILYKPSLLSTFLVYAWEEIDI